ncbi:MAG TPA: biotin transporter BioY [Terracidiphilus sp.]|jgi:biotin transport system substrate-specific component|nr:biotin transporter BioY [Terracidiphilus sp.]
MNYQSPTRVTPVSQPVLVANSSQSLVWMRNLLIILSGSLLVGVCAHVTLPLTFTPVPLTLQDFAVMALGLLLAPRLASATMIAYLAEGAMGFPVFAPNATGMTGLAHILGPTGGFLMAYPFMAMVISYLWRTGERTFIGALVAATSGNMILLTLGGAWFGFLTHVSPQIVFAEAVMPFVPGDAIKIILAAFVGLEWYQIRPAPRRGLATIYTNYSDPN